MKTIPPALSRNRWLIATAAAAVVLIAGARYVVQPQRAPAPSIDVSLVDGGRVDSAQLKGQVVLLEFWATDCTTCVGEMPRMIEFQRSLGPLGLRVLAVALASDDPTYVRNFARTRALPFDVAWDGDGRTAASFGEVRLTPTLVLIDRHGRIAGRYVGAPDFALLQKRIRSLLSEA